MYIKALFICDKTKKKKKMNIYIYLIHVTIISVGKCNNILRIKNCLIRKQYFLTVP